MSGQSAGKVNYVEQNNHMQGRSGSGTKKKKGPAVGRTSGNPTKGGGIRESTKGKS